MMNVMIAGICEQTGRCLADHLSKHTNHVSYAIVHKKDLLQALQYMDKEKVAIIHSETDEVDPILAGMDAVICANRSDEKTNDPQVLKSFLQETKALIHAAVNNQVKHFILLSAIGADDPQGSLEHYLYKKREIEDHLKNSGLTYTIIRVGELSKRTASGKVMLGENIEWVKDLSISYIDAAKVIAAALESKQVTNKTVEVISGDMDVEDAFQSV